ncbi:MAG: response regulator transcription factor [Blautia sp.]|mgnify:FL=1|uniref:Stage 0 sporulation protein A homolog n=1 Tax=Blautia argi TaxID=1912897 RepID=A0A2Z4U913_9FIRM|nr:MULTISPECIES: response regulator transcription factor [Blautia]AWY97532.1 DNA-binding response regulator [Blautia argi]
MKILIIEDDKGLRTGISFSLAQEGYEVLEAGTAKEGLRLFEKEGPGAVLMDLNLPDMDGLLLCQRIREGARTPVLMVTARDMETDELLGLESGADDYITKPFSIAVLKLRLKKLLEREVKGESRENRMASGNLCMDLKMMKVLVDREELECSMTEFKLLKFFLENRGQVLTQNQILEAVWDLRGRYVNANTLQVNVGRLRKKLEAAGCTAQVKTIHGIGYLWEEA